MDFRALNIAGLKHPVEGGRGARCNKINKFSDVNFHASHSISQIELTARYENRVPSVAAIEPLAFWCTIELLRNVDICVNLSTAFSLLSFQV